MSKTDDLDRCQAVIGHQFKNVPLLKLALTHASVADNRTDSNERLEFLGDAVLGLVVCDYLYGKYPDFLEGELTKIKSAVVSRRTCAEVAQDIRLPELLYLGKGMGSSGLPDSLAAAVLESVIAAIFLDAGLAPAREFILRHLTAHIDRAVQSEHQDNYKSQLQQHAQKLLMGTPSYELLDEKGPDHSKCFEIAVNIGGRRFPGAWGNSKKEAEQKAALSALHELKLVGPAAVAPEAAVPPSKAPKAAPPRRAKKKPDRAN